MFYLSDLLFETFISSLIIFWIWNVLKYLNYSEYFVELFIKKLALFLSSCIFLHSLFLFYYFDPNSVYNFQLTQQLIVHNFFNFFGTNVVLSIDGLSFWFILLTTLIFPLCILSSWKLNLKLSVFYWILFFILEFFILSCFLFNDIFLFYICFEAILIPMFILIGVWGSRTRRIKAAYYFFFYTFISSIFFLLGIILIYWQIGTTSYEIIKMYSIFFTSQEQVCFWFLFFFAFAVKIPMFPFHIWLPEAHVEAPTAGSVLLAGILLKLGGYGFLKFLIPLFPKATFYFLPFVNTLAILSIFYATFTILRQIDLKKIIAYSSIAHMNLIVLGIFSLNHHAIVGAIFLMLGHGLVSSALFILVGILYERHFSKSIFYYTGLTTVMPNFSLFFLFYTFANLGFPGLSNFVGEFLIILGIINYHFFYFFNLWIFLILFVSLFFSAIYAVWLYNRICFGTLKTKYITLFNDIDYREFFILFVLAFLVLLIGVFPQFVIEYTQISVKHILLDYCL